MESFFLSETAKYLYLLHSNATALPNFYLFSTEGHLMPVLALEETSRITTTTSRAKPQKLLGSVSRKKSGGTVRGMHSSLARDAYRRLFWPLHHVKILRVGCTD